MKTTKQQGERVRNAVIKYLESSTVGIKVYKPEVDKEYVNKISNNLKSIVSSFTTNP